MSITPTIYFDHEAPDYNYGLNGKLGRLAANRAVICLMTEWGLRYDCRMKPYQINMAMENIQSASIIRL
jgi:hypothetical protein